MKRLTGPLVRRLVQASAVLGALVVASWLWMLADLPIFVDRFLIQSQKPIQARAIVCIGGGLGANNLPTAEGWQRIYTAVQLYVDGFAPTVIMSGGMGTNISEAEVYADAAQWLGVPKQAIVLIPYPSSTAEQPASILRAPGVPIDANAALDVVTSSLNSKRVFLCFKHAGFKNVNIVSSWVARKRDARLVREQRKSTLTSFRPSGKSYGDIVNRTRWKLDYLFVTVRELAALGWYRATGRI